MPYAPTNGIELYYERAGTGEPVIFVHGGFPSLAMALADVERWDWSWEHDFARRFDFVWYDRRGCYRSACPDDGYGLADQVRDLAGLLDALALDAAHLVGSSAGGQIALMLAATAPRRVRSLVLAGTGLVLFPADDPVSQQVCQQIGLLERAGTVAAWERRPAGVEATYQSLWGHEEAAARGRLERYRAREAELARQAGAIPLADRIRRHAVELRAMHGAMAADLSPLARQVTCPTLVLHGSDDRDVPLAAGADLAQAIPGATLRVIAGGGHGIIHREPAGRQAAIDFLSDLARSS